MKPLTNAPLPSIKDICGLLTRNIIIDEKELSSPWMSDEDLGFWLSRSAWSIFLIAKYHFSLLGKDKISVWCPSYFCNASLAPLRELNINLIFYPILDDGSPNIDQCKKILINNPSPDLFIAVHYFGCTVELTDTAAFVNDHEAWLIEDAAHILQPQPKMGEHSHFLLFSPHKFLPIPDGAILVIKKINFIKHHKFKLLLFEDLYNSVINQTQQKKWVSVYWIVKRLIQKTGIKLTLKNKNDFKYDELVMDTEDFIHPKMSSVAKKLLSTLVGTLKSESYERLKNYMFWLQLLKNSPMY